MDSRKLMMGCFAIVLGIICYQDIAKCKEAPWPPRIIGAGIVFGLLSLFALVAEELANLVAVGIVLALGLATITKKGGFQPECGPHSCATAQPSSYQSLAAPATPANPNTTQV